MEAEERTVPDCNFATLRMASRRVTHFYDCRLAAAGLRSTQFSILALLADRSAVTINVLAASLDLERSTAGQTLKVLERDGLIQTGPAERDRRLRVARLTAAGSAKVVEATPIWRNAQADFERLNGEALAAGMRRALVALKIPAT